MNPVPEILEVGGTYRFFFHATTVCAKVNEIDERTGWIAVSVAKVGDYWMNLRTVSGIQTEAGAKKAEEASAKAAKNS